MLTESQRTYMAIEAALRAGDLEAVRAAFGDTPGFPDVRDPLTWTHLLSLAISWSPAPLVAQLLDLGADPNFSAPDGFPAVYGALSHDRADKIDLMRLLLSHGADPSLRTRIDYCATPIEEAELMGNDAGARMLERLL